MHNVAICIPARDQVHTVFAHCLAMMACHWSVQNVPSGGMLHVFHSQGTLIASQRQDLLETAIKAGATHALFLDTDMRFPKDTLSRLLAHDVPIVAASYAERRSPVKTVAFANDRSWDRVYTDESSNGLEPVAAVGMGCMLIRLDAVSNMERPHFMIGYSAANAAFVGEDIFFCRKVRKMGHQVLIDHDLSKEVRHLGTFEYSHEHAVMERDHGTIEQHGA